MAGGAPWGRRKPPVRPPWDQAVPWGSHAAGSWHRAPIHRRVPACTRSTAQAPRPVVRSGQGRRHRPPSMARAEATHSPRLAATTDKKYPQGCCCRHVAEHGPSRICAEPPRLRTPRVKVRSAQGLPCLHPTRARQWPCSSVIIAEITVPAMPAPPLWDQDPRGPMDRASPCSPPWVRDPTGAGLAGEWELLDGWGGGVAVVVGLVHPPVWSLPK